MSGRSREKNGIGGGRHGLVIVFLFSPRVMAFRLIHQSPLTPQKNPSKTRPEVLEKEKQRNLEGEGARASYREVGEGRGVGGCKRRGKL